MAASGNPQQAALARRLQRRIAVEWRWATALLLAAVFFLNTFGGVFGLNRLDNILHDTLARLSVYRATPLAEQIVIIAVDDNSIAELGFWPWPRRVHGELLEILSGARAVGLDFLFSEPNPAYPADDERLAQAIQKHGSVVLATMIDPQGRPAIGPLSLLDQATPWKGYINIKVDADGILREVEPYRMADGQMQLHFVPRLLQAGDALNAWQRLLNKPQRPLRIPWVGPAAALTTIPYHEVLAGNIDAQTFQDKFVLVGAWSSGLGDIFTTPTTGSGPPMAGVEVLANILHASLADRWIQSPPNWLTSLLLLGPVLLACIACRVFSPQRAFLSCVVLLGLVLLAAAGLLTLARWWVGPSASLLGCALAYPIWSWRSQHAALSHINDELSLLDTDIREKSLHSKRHSSRQTLMNRVAQLHQAIEVFRQTRRRRDETIRFLSHDMRAPLNSILAICEMQRQELKTEEETKTMAQFEYYTRQTLALVDGLVDLGHAEGKALLTTPTDLADVLRQSCDNSWARARSKDIRIDYPETDAPAWVKADATLLERAFNNILDNAVKYSPAGSAIQCTVDAEDAYWAVSIQDQGMGIPKKELEHIFEPFQRVNFSESADHPKGAGLGLAFVQTVVQRHDGWIQVSSQVGAGTRFIIRLPQADSPTV